jgi:hypothetical protein
LPEFPRNNPDESDKTQQEFLLKCAWEHLDKKTGANIVFADVDLECLAALEERMFEDSAKAGIAGNQQWGLDAGSHQCQWYPYEGLPAHWNYGDRPYSETELEVRNYAKTVLQTH